MSVIVHAASKSVARNPMVSPLPRIAATPGDHFAHGKFSFSQTKFGFTVAPQNPIEFVFHTDRDGAASRSAWTVQKTGLKSP